MALPRRLSLSWRMTYIQILPTPTRSFSFFGELQKDLRGRRVGGFGRLWESSLKKLKSVTAAVMSTKCLFVFPVPAPCVDLLSLPLSIRLQHLTPVSRLHFFSRLRCRDYFLFLPPGVSSASGSDTGAACHSAAVMNGDCWLLPWDKE